MVIITSENVEQLSVILIASIPLFGLAIDWLKRKLGEKQGDLAFEQLIKWADDLSSLSLVVPELEPITKELKSLIESSQKLWDDPTNNHDMMIVVIAKAGMLYSEAMKLIAKYLSKPKV